MWFLMNTMDSQKTRKITKLIDPTSFVIQLTGSSQSKLDVNLSVFIGYLGYFSTLGNKSFSSGSKKS